MKRKCFHVLPHFHYDILYINTYEGYMKIVMDILKKALEMMGKVKWYTFGVEQTLVLEEFIRRHPGMKQKLARALKKGQMEVTCGMYCMPDMNIPSGESLIRQIKRGKDWLRSEFGIEPRVCLITDCFGHNRQIPQILKKCGYDYYSFARGMVKLGPPDFWWQGIDGCFLGFDTIGWEEFSPETERVRRIAVLVGKGYAGQLLLSSDLCRRSFYHEHGGRGYDHVLRHFVPVLREQGISAADIGLMLADNPKQVLSF